MAAGGGVARRAVGVVGVYRGPEAHLVGLMRPLLAASPRAPTRRLVAASSFLESIAETADPESTERAGRASHLARSDYFARPLPADAAMRAGAPGRRGGAPPRRGP